MNLGNQFNRIGHLFHNGIEKTRHAPDDLMDKGLRQGRALADRVRRQADFRKVVTAEEALVRHVRENPALYLIGASLIIGALLANVLIQRRALRHAPLL